MNLRRHILGAIRFVGRHCRGPLPDGLAAGAAAFAAAVLSLCWLYHAAYHAQIDEVRSGLVRFAQAAASCIDVADHETLRDASQHNGDEYQRIIAPLEHLHRCAPDIKYIYTARVVDGVVRFVLDTAEPIDADGDGVIDQARLMEEFDDVDPRLFEVLQSGEALALAEPVTDKWGTFLTAYAPLIDRDGCVVAVVGVDMLASEFATRLTGVRQALLQGLIPALLISAVAAFVVYGVRNHERRVREQREHYAKAMEHNNALLSAAIKATEQATRAKSDFLAKMSHELRTPLAAIIGFSEMLIDEDESDADPHTRDISQTISRNGEHLLGLINDILDLSRIEARKLAVTKVRVSPAELANEVLHMLAPRAAIKGLRCELHIDGPVPETIESDPMRIKQVLVNLMGNAIKFTSAGTVRLILDYPDPVAGPLRLRVVDSGIGISAEAQSRLFRPFEQADQFTTRRFGGSGLGLAISRELAALLGGEVNVSSVAGEGSTFTLTVDPGPRAAIRLRTYAGEFPAIGPATHQPDVPAQSDAVATPRRPAPAPLANQRVLLVEDGPDNQRLISAMLRKAGAEVTLAPDGQEGCAAVVAANQHRRPFDLIVMDMQMPVLDGYEATRRLRQSGVKTPILALTAHAMSDDRARCLEAGCDEFATKPIDRRRLLDTCAALIAQRRAAPAAEGA